ncbi:MAG: SOS response-associated peptidase, partial [Candidatus Andersenbacteria bacterium]
MCGRYSFFDTEQLFERFNVPKVVLEDRYNVAPSFDMPVIIDDGSKHIEVMKWGLIPHWAKEEKTDYKLINARIETLAEKPTFKNLLKSQRCLVPARGFFEWHRTDEGKEPYYFHLDDIFAFAGLYDVWEHDDKVIDSYTIITANAEGGIADIHNRMPVILTQKAETDWLNPDLSEPDEALRVLDLRRDD